MEKESLTKGVPLGHAHDIDIPPPRPKRKPSNPYPRKTSVGSIPSSSPGARDVKPVTSISSLCPSRQALDLENDPPPEDHPGIETCQRTKETPKDSNCSEVLNNFQEAPSAFISHTRITSVSIPEVLTKKCASSECVPPLKEINGPTTADGSYLTAESKSNQKLGKTDISNTDLNISRREGPNLEDYSLPTHEKVAPEQRTNEMKQQREKLDALSIETESINCPTREFVNVAHTLSFDRTSPVSVSHHSGDQENPNPFPIPPISPTTEQYVNSGRPAFYPSFPIPHPPFTLFRNNHDSYRSFLNISSTFSGLIISTLLQNPAVHAAATVAASFWPCADNSATDTLVGGCPVRQTGQSPSLTAIVAATVAAASAWWASHGLLPFYPPPHTSFAFPPTATTNIPTEGTTQVTEDNKEITDGMLSYPGREDQRFLDPEFSTALRAQDPATKPSPLPSPDSDENGGESAHAALQKASSHGQMTVPCPGMPDTDEGKTRKLLDRSSCGSNTASSSEVETDALEKHAEGNEDSKEAGDEPINRRCKNIGSNSDSWKEVSEEGRLAFQALFSREVLPQSFKPAHNLRNKALPKTNDEEEKQKSSEKGKVLFKADIGNGIRVTPLDNPQFIDEYESVTSDITEKGPLTNMLAGHHGKLRGFRTGFKPYKRCSMEVSEGSMVANSSKQSEEKSTKRIRLGGEAST